MSKNVLLTGAYAYTPEQIRAIEELGWTATLIKEEREPLGIPTDHFEAVVCNNLFLYNDIADFRSLKFVQATSAGLERLPVEYMEKHQILYRGAAGVYSVPMAEWAVMSILEIYRDAYGFFKKQQEKKWEKNRGLLELSGRKVCIVGCGSVGQETARRLAAFDTEITAVNRSRVENETIKRWVPFGQLNQVLPETDIVILSIALTEETKGLMNEERLGLMKEGSVLVNLSRGGIVEEEALIRELKKGRLRGAALDVFEEEPLREESPLWEMPGVLVSPHNAFVGDKVRERMFSVIYRNLKYAAADFDRMRTEK